MVGQIQQTIKAILTAKINHRIYTIFIATVWLVNGLIGKVLDLVPRHQQIVQKITHFEKYTSNTLTVIIGISEIAMALWVLSDYKSKLGAITQIIVVITMNILEFLLVPELLLWGRFNIVFAFLFSYLVYHNEFELKRKLKQQTKK